MKRATRPAFLVRLVNRFRATTSASKTPMQRQPKRYHVNLAQAANGGDAQHADLPLRKEAIASFADVCCAKGTRSLTATAA
jgi:hypothetical protein